MVELIIEYPVYSILIAVAILIFFIVLFKVGNFLESFDWAGGGKSKDKSKKEKVVNTTKEKSTSTDNKVSSESKVNKDVDLNSAKTVSETIQGEPNSKSNNNYLYDRYVDHPSKEDNFAYSSKINDAFLSDSEIDAIQKRKIKIRVKENEEKSNSAVYKKLQEMSSQDDKDREKLLDEFEHLPRTMKLLLIKNIMHNID